MDDRVSAVTGPGNKCLRCGGHMSHGVVLPDPPVVGATGMSRIWRGRVMWQSLRDYDPSPPLFFPPPLKNAAPVYAFRCDACGWLEFYALREPPGPMKVATEAPNDVDSDPVASTDQKEEEADQGDSEL